MTETTIRELSDLLWDRVLDRDPLTALRCGRPVTTLPRGGPEAAERDATFAAATLGRLAAADAADAAAAAADGVSGSAETIDAAFLRDHLDQEIAEAQRIWYRFPVTPYNAMTLSLYREEILAAAELATADDANRYLNLLNDFTAIVEQIGDTMRAQRQRGIRLPAWAVPEAIATMRGHAEACTGLLVAPDRCRALAAGRAGQVSDGAAALVGGRLARAFLRVLADLADDEKAGGEDAGIGQYPGGAECYNGLIGLHTGLDLSAEQVHEIGLAELDRINGELGVKDEQAYRASLFADPTLYATSSRDVERIFQAHIDRVLPELPRHFSRLPAASFLLHPLNAELSGMTYGYYDTSAGCYRYNASNLPERPLLQAASLMYHEGLPGHHLQMGLLAENAALHPIRREQSDLRTFALNGYLEGWAEYAAGLCDELGMYADPRDRYGRLTSERFFAARLVVDTGLAVLGWPLDRAAACLRENGFMSEPEIASELLRYAVDDPGQALGYHLGHWYLRELRGSRDTREFHDAVLGSGPLPLRVLKQALNPGQTLSARP